MGLTQSTPNFTASPGYIDTPAPTNTDQTSAVNPPIRASRPLYTAEERRRRDATPWTVVQGILAPAQFVAFAFSLYFVFRFLATGEGLFAAHASIVVKTLFLYAIMVTGAIWEKVVFGRYLFAPSFFMEDVFSMLVIALHTAYLAALATGALSSDQLMYLALAAYLTYVINAGQFLIKLRMARLESERTALEAAE
jgi:3-vinyl bacteriochlorophyllide hydratase